VFTGCVGESIVVQLPTRPVFTGARYTLPCSRAVSTGRVQWKCGRSADTGVRNNIRVGHPCSRPVTECTEPNVYCPAHPSIPCCRLAGVEQSLIIRFPSDAIWSNISVTTPLHATPSEYLTLHQPPHASDVVNKDWTHKNRDQSIKDEDKH